MVTLNQFLELADAPTFPEKLVIINSWTNYTLTGALMVAIGVILYGLMRYSGIENISAFVASMFACFAISTLLWAVQFAGLPLIHGAFPVLFLILTGIAGGMKILENR